MIDVLYFASLRDRLNRNREQLELPPGVQDVAGLMEHLAQRGDAWKEVFDSEVKVLSAVNQEMSRADAPVADGDEIGFFPPVTGG